MVLQCWICLDDAQKCSLCAAYFLQLLGFEREASKADRNGGWSRPLGILWSGSMRWLCRYRGIEPHHNNYKHTHSLGPSFPILVADAAHPTFVPSPPFHLPSSRVTLIPAKEAVILAPELLLKGHGGRAAYQVALLVLCVTRWVDDDGGAGEKRIVTRIPLAAWACCVNVFNVPLRLESAGVRHQDVRGERVGSVHVCIADLSY